MDEMKQQELLANREIELVDTRALRQIVKLLEMATDTTLDLYERAGPRNGQLWKERVSDIGQLDAALQDAQATAKAVLEKWGVEED
jgi:hypothetical protein|tara:strand:- start:95 stop:352 length:258 start_codon:yes stop_codon:yes gene_type:complete